jgi:hypothetical protein
MGFEKFLELFPIFDEVFKHSFRSGAQAAIAGQFVGLFSGVAITHEFYDLLSAADDRILHSFLDLAAPRNAFEGFGPIPTPQLHFFFVLILFQHFNLHSQYTTITHEFIMGY